MIGGSLCNWSPTWPVPALGGNRLSKRAREGALPPNRIVTVSAARDQPVSLLSGALPNVNWIRTGFCPSQVSYSWINKIQVRLEP